MTWYVSPSGNNNNDCTTPTTPCATLQTVVDKAGIGETIRAATGTYTRDTGTEVVGLTKSVNLSGGWNENFSVQDGISTIDGLHRLTILKASSNIDVIISKFRMYNGAGAYIGGILNSATMLIQDCIIDHITHIGIRNESSGDLTLLRSIVRDNSGANYGAGIYNDGALILI